MVLTVRGIGRGGGAVVPSVRSCGGVRSESREEQLQGVSGFLDSMGRLVECLRESHGGQGSLGCSDGVESPRRSNSPAAGHGLKSGVGVARTGASELGVGIGHGAEL